MTTTDPSTPQSKSTAPVPGLRILGSGSILLSKAVEHWKSAPPVPAPPVLVALDGTPETLAGLARTAVPGTPAVLIANLDEPALALAAAACGTTVRWISTRQPHQKLGVLGEDIHGAWLEDEETLRIADPSGDRTFWVPARLPGDLMPTVLAGACLGSLLGLPAHAIQKWIQSFSVTPIHPVQPATPGLAIAA